MSWSQSDTTAAETVAYSESLRESKDPETYHLDKALYHLDKLRFHIKTVGLTSSSTEKYSQLEELVLSIMTF
jgi:hypothetical protein